ncbi:MAG TPA: YciI family protein [Gemmatimonadaceae bacterium]|nr:YciI family protein [Gemmatimonadaceae bacterium]
MRGYALAGILLAAEGLAASSKGARVKFSGNTRTVMSQVPQSLFAAMGEFVEEHIKNGTLIDGAGLQPLAKATRVRVAGGRITVTDGPFSEAKEVIGGYSLIEARTPAEAVALATRFMELHRMHWPDFVGECEVRPLEDMSELPQS